MVVFVTVIPSSDVTVSLVVFVCVSWSETAAGLTGAELLSGRGDCAGEEVSEKGSLVLASVEKQTVYNSRWTDHDEFR